MKVRRGTRMRSALLCIIFSLCPCRMSRGPSGFSAGPGPGGQGAPADNDPKGMTLAAKMMEKMGWKVLPAMSCA